MIYLMNKLSRLKPAFLGICLCMSLGMVQAQVTDIAIIGTQDSTGVEGDTVRVPVIVSADGLADENILAFKLSFYHSANLKPIGFSTDDSAISGWNYNTNITSDNNFSFSGAGVTAIQMDSAVLFWVDFELQEVSSSTSGSYYLTGSDHYFNEGDYNITMMGANYGRISITNIPDLTVSVNPSTLLRGDSAAINVSNGSGEYTYTPSDPTIASITSGNYLLAEAPGVITVRVDDENAGSGVSNNVEIRGFKLSGEYPEGPHYQKDTITFHITTTDLSDLEVLAGSFEFYVSGAEVLSVDNVGTILESVDIEVDSLDVDRRKVAFASASTISGTGNLVRVTIKTTSNGTGVYFSGTTIFNEDLVGVHGSASISLSPLPTPNITPVSSIPNPILPGNIINFDVSGEVGPVTWSLSDPTVGTIDMDGVFTAERSGKSSIVVVDSLGGEGTYGPLTIKDGTLEIASEVAVFASDHLLPIKISDLPSGRELFAFDFKVSIDTSKITFVEVVKAGSLTENYSIVANSADPRHIKIVGAGDQSISTSGDLLYFKVNLKPSFVSSSTYLYFSEVNLNEGLPDLHLINGQVTPGDPPPIAGDTMLTILEDEVYYFDAEDFAYSQPQGKPMARVQIQSGPTKGTLLYNGSDVTIDQIIQVENFDLFNYRAPKDSSGDDYASFSVRVGDADYFSNNTGTVTFDITPVNDPPRFSVDIDSIGVDEDFTEDVSFTVSATAPPQEEGETYTYSIEPDEISFAIMSFDGSTGNVSFSAIQDSTGTQVFKLYGHDSQAENNTDSIYFTFHVEAINDQPVAYDSTFSLNENSEVGTVVGQFGSSDVDGDELTFSLTEVSSNLGLAIDASTGDVTVSDVSLMDFETNPLIELEAIASDGALSDTAIVTINLIDQNDAPLVDNQTFVIAEDIATDGDVGTVEAVDQDGDALTYDLTGGNASGTFALDELGNLTVNDASLIDFETVASYTLTIAVSDGTSSSNAVISVEVTNVNEAPSLDDRTLQVNENAPNGFVVSNLATTDPDGDDLTYAILSGNDLGGFALNASSGKLTVLDTEVMDFETNPSFTLEVEVSDGQLSDTGTITIALNDLDESINQAPQISNQTLQLDENVAEGTAVGTISAGDPNGDPITFSVVAGNTEGSFEVNSETGAVTLATGAQVDFETQSTYEMTVEVSDGSLSAQGVITIEINDLNEQPTLADASFSINENSVVGFLVGTLTGDDPDGDVLTYSISAGNSLGAFLMENSTGKLRVENQAALDFETTPIFTLTVEVSDGELTNSATVTVSLNDVDESVNQAPQIQDQSFTVSESASANTSLGTIAAGDADGDALTFSFSGTSRFEVDASTGALTLVAADLDFETEDTYTFTVEVSDGALTSSAIMTVEVLDENEAPTLSDATFGLPENSIKGTVVGQLTFSDPENDVLDLNITSGNQSEAFAINASGELVVNTKSALDFETTPTFSLTVQATDGAFIVSAVVVVNLEDVDESVNQAPQIVAQSFSIEENSAGGTTVGTVIAEDPDDDGITFTIISGDETAFSIDAATGEITVVEGADLDYETSTNYSYNVQVSDGSLTASADITIQIIDVDESVNAAPQINGQSFTINENSIVGTSVGTVAASDPDGDNLTYTITSGDTGAFELDANTGALTVADQSQLDFETTPTFNLIVKVSDGALFASASVVINLNDIDETVNQAPQIVDQSFDIDENSANGTEVGTVAASDIDGDPLSYSITDGSGAFQIDANSGVMTVADQSQLDFETTTSFSITVEVSDGALTASATITVTLNDIDETVNQSPQIIDQSFDIDENSANGTAVGTVVASDADGDPLSYSITDGSGAFQIDASSGAMAVADQSQLDFETTPSFSITVEVSDGALTASATMTITLNDVDENSAPEISDQSFTIDENSPNGSIVGTVVASDPESDVLTFTILSGNDLGGFDLDQSSGVLTVADVNVLDFETTPSFSITVEVSDGALSTSAIVNIQLNDLDDETILNNQPSTLTIYPNPTSNMLYFENAQDIKEVVLYDYNGKLIIRKVDRSYSIDLKNLKEGVYLVKYLEGDKWFSQRIIKN
ncbi:MAG: cadherin domain-containing protein [Marinoscillum sp.]